jgi:hypothetical protein
MQSPGTPAAGILLWWSGKFLDEPKYQEAATQAARTIAAVQNSSGQIPQKVIFGVSANGRDEPRAVPDRSATCAALAFTLTLIDEDQTKPAARAAHRASHWLLKQQNEDGGWPAAFPPDATLGKVIRLIRLDDANYRDATYAMLLSSDSLGDSLFAKSAEKSIAKLLSLRQSIRQATTQPLESSMTLLWSTAYRPSGAIDPTLGDFPAGVDVVASRCAMQTLLGAYLINGEKQAGPALDSAAQALLNLRNPDGTWQRIYLAQSPTTQPTTSPTTEAIFDAPTTKPAQITGTFELQPILDAAQQLKLVGRDKYLAVLNQQFSIKQRLAATLCGLCDDPLSVDQYLQKRDADFATLDDPPPDELSGRLKRLWLLFIRAKLERSENP